MPLLTKFGRLFDVHWIMQSRHPIFTVIAGKFKFECELGACCLLCIMRLNRYVAIQLSIVTTPVFGTCTTTGECMDTRLSCDMPFFFSDDMLIF